MKITMSEDDLIQLNEAIDIIKTTCEYCKVCIECPMNHNCNEHPAKWEAVDNGKEETT